MDEFSIEDVEEMVEYIKTHWYDHDNYSGLNLFYEKGYDDLVIWYIMQTGAIDSELCYEYAKPIERMIEQYYENFVLKSNIQEQIDECLEDVTVYINPSNETQFISKELHGAFISEQDLNKWGFYKEQGQ